MKFLSLRQREGELGGTAYARQQGTLEVIRDGVPRDGALPKTGWGVLF